MVYKLGDYGRWCKWSNMDIDTNIPLIFSVPNGGKGEICDQVVEALDLYPTLAELCGLENPTQIERESLVPWLNNPALKSNVKKYAYTVWPHNRWNYDKTIMGYSVKDERFNYVEWIKISSGELLARELYDHSNDPAETRNVVNDSKYDTVLSQLANQSRIRQEATDHDHDFKNLR